jgi:hypothetical protein
MIAKTIKEKAGGLNTQDIANQAWRLNPAGLPDFSFLDMRLSEQLKRMSIALSSFL